MPLCTCNYPFYSAYNSLNHRVNFGQFKLCTDIEKNLGPSVYVDATKTVHAPYCQGNVTVFGENAGQQCVAMSLCALVYIKITKIILVGNMTQIMIVGIQSLSYFKKKLICQWWERMYLCGFVSLYLCMFGCLLQEPIRLKVL